MHRLPHQVLRHFLFPWQQIYSHGNAMTLPGNAAKRRERLNRLVDSDQVGICKRCKTDSGDEWHSYSPNFDQVNILCLLSSPGGAGLQDNGQCGWRFVSARELSDEQPQGETYLVICTQLPQAVCAAVPWSKASAAISTERVQCGGENLSIARYLLISVVSCSSKRSFLQAVDKCFFLISFLTVCYRSKLFSHTFFPSGKLSY